MALFEVCQLSVFTNSLGAVFITQALRQCVRIRSDRFVNLGSRLVLDDKISMFLLADFRQDGHIVHQGLDYCFLDLGRVVRQRQYLG